MSEIQRNAFRIKLAEMMESFTTVNIVELDEFVRFAVSEINLTPHVMGVSCDNTRVRLNVGA